MGDNPSDADWMRLLVESTVDYAIFMLDPAGRVATWNTGAERLKGWTEDEIVGRHFSVFYPPEQVDAGHPDRELEVAASEGRYQEEGWRVRKDGGRFWAGVTITALRRPDGRLIGFGKVTRDLTERWRAEEHLRRMATQDGLTGLPNRAQLIKRLTEVLARATRSRTDVAVLFVDIDRFKEINDSLGHRSGDQVLVAVAERVTAAVRPYDLSARIGGDEFVVVCEGCGVEEAGRVASRIHEALAQPLDVDGTTLRITCTTGITASDLRTDAEDLVAEADAAMYDGKRAGRSQHSYFDRAAEDGRPDR